MKRLITLASLLGVLLFVSCGQQYDAECLVKDFVKQNALNPDKVDILSFSKLNTTKVIKDSLVQDMQQRESPVFKSGINYAMKTSGNMLYFIRMEYVYDEGDTLKQTFYLDEQLEQVVAFK